MKREFQLSPQLSLSLSLLLLTFILMPQLCITVYQDPDNNCQQFQVCVYIIMFDFHRAINTLCPLPFTSYWLGYSLWTGKLCLMLCKVAISSLLLSLFSINYFQQGHRNILAKICRCPLWRAISG